MSYPPGFLFQPSVPLALPSCPPFSSGVILGPRTEELGSASTSAFAPYSGPATSPGFGAPLRFGGEPRAAVSLGSFVGPGYDPSPSISGALDYHPFGALGPFPYADPSYRKNATRDATATLKAWLGEHRKNPYPTKGEKIMLAIITKMTLTQVSTWFANARRRLKKENKMTWTPRNRSEDEEEEDNMDPERTHEDEVLMKANNDVLEVDGESAGRGPPSAPDSCGQTYREGDTDPGLTDPDFKHLGDGRLPHVSGPTATGDPLQNTQLGPLGVSELEHRDSRGTTQGPHPAPKPKLWSLAEIATSSDKSKGCNESSQGRGAGQQFPHSPALPRHLYYTSPFIPGYASYSPLGPPHSSAGSHLSGLQQTMLQTAVARDCRLRSQSQLQLHELKQGTANV